jgi:hypothetical protein
MAYKPGTFLLFVSKATNAGGMKANPIAFTVEELAEPLPQAL